MTKSTQIGEIVSVHGDTVTAVISADATPGLLFSEGHAYFVGQVGAYVRIPLGLTNLFAVVTQVGADPLANEGPERENSSRTWLRLELIGESTSAGGFQRGISQYPAISAPVLLVNAQDLGDIYKVSDHERAINIGHVANAPHLPGLVDVTSLVTRHGAVVGSTGSGKSTTVASIVNELANPDRFPSARILVIDVHGEYGKAFRDRATSFRIDATESDFAGSKGEQLYLPYWALPLDDLIDLAFGAIDDNSATYVQNLVLAAKREYLRAHPIKGVEATSVTPDSPIPFSIRKIWMQLHEMHYATHTATGTGQSEATIAYEVGPDSSPLRGDAEKVIPPSYRPATTGGSNRIYLSGAAINMRRQVNTLGARLRDPRYNFLFSPGEWDVRDSTSVSSLGSFLERWLGNENPVVVADLSAVPNQVLQRVISVLLRLLYDALLWARKLSEGARERPLLIVLEEAHRYLRPESQGAGEIVERIVKEGRKFGVGALIVSQRPSEIRPTILSQLGSFFVMRLTNAGDRAIVRSTMPDNLSGLFDSVSVLRTGEALITGDVVKLPTRVVISSSVNRRPDSEDPVLLGRLGPGGWDAIRAPQDFEDVASVWLRLDPVSLRVVSPRS